MKCVYCDSVMLFNGTTNTFICADNECGAKFTIVQHPELMTHTNILKYDTNIGKERPDDMKKFNRDGIATQWYRGNK